MNQDAPASVEVVLKAELDLLARQRAGKEPKADAKTGIYPRARAMNLTGLAFSGGGIRSAAYNLGFLQGLANRKALPLFDYLSTVSGGGYIGGWFSALLRRAYADAPGETQMRDFQQRLATPPDPLARDGGSGFPPPESHPVRFVRRFANYLTPRLGLSGDTLALLAIMLRNVVVMQMLLVSLLVTGFALLLWLIVGEVHLPVQAPYPVPEWLRDLYAWAGVTLSAPGRWLMPPALALLFLSLLLALRSQSSRRGHFHDPLPNFTVFVALLAALTSGLFFTLGIRVAAQADAPTSGGFWVAYPAAAYCLAWIGALRQERAKLPRALAGMLGGAATLALALHLCMEDLPAILRAAPAGYATAFAPPAAIAVYALILTVHLALAGSALSEQQREWWARAGGQCGAIGLAWTLAVSMLLFAPPLMQAGAEWSLAGGGLWTALSWFGARMAQGKETGGNSPNPLLELAARLAPWLFLLGLVGLVAWVFVSLLPGVYLGAVGIEKPWLGVHIATYHAGLVSYELATARYLFLGAGAVFLLLLAFIDLNLFSAHSFYRNRLSRTFLGASRDKRSPNPYTGFDHEDNMKLDQLAGQRPLHLINANLNLAGGQELGWQTRRGASFLFSPLYCGYSSRSSLGKELGGYRPTQAYADRMTLATTMAVSGAAASPNMGFHTSAPVAALLTAFNLRLARWCPNPERDQWRRREPLFWSAGPLFAELSGEASGESRWVNVSDGGHFENLGLYELVRRRAALIVVTDLGEDGNYQFDDLAMAVRKISVDFGVEVEITAEALDAIRPKGDKDGPKFSEKIWALGRIRYPDCAPGYLVYVKSAMPADAPIDIRQYRDAHPEFPHESTIDQWFDENQFEAYRRLGQQAAEAVCDALLQGAPDADARERVADLLAKWME